MQPQQGQSNTCLVNRGQKAVGRHEAYYTSKIIHFKVVVLHMLVQLFKIEDHSMGSVFFGSYKNRRDKLPWFLTGFNDKCFLKQVSNLFRNDIIFFSTKTFHCRGRVFDKA